MNDNICRGKMSFIQFHPVNVKGNWTHLAQKKSRPGAKINIIFKIPWKFLNCIITKTF